MWRILFLSCRKNQTDDAIGLLLFHLSIFMEQKSGQSYNILLSYSPH